MLMNGKWVADWQPVQAKDEKGSFVRQTSSFRNWITPDGSAGPTGEGGFKAEPGRYHLYVALICPWASRTLIGRKLKGLDDAISVSVVEPELSDQGWRFGDTGGADLDTLNGANFLQRRPRHFGPRDGAGAVGQAARHHREQRIRRHPADAELRVRRLRGPHLRPLSADLREEIDALNARIYPRLNNGVYRAGFATTQAAYEEAFHDVFAMLDELEELLRDGRSFLFGERLTEADVRLFVTLVRFDVAYHGLFKCNMRRIADYPALSAYQARILAIPGVRHTVSIDHIKRGYYSIKALNPTGIVPVGPELSTVLAV